MKSLTKLFGLLTDWRTLPAYQLERRADIFFALYLEDLLKYCDFFAPNEPLTVIPEFPAKHADNHQSDRIDYMVCSEHKIVYVELKTDNRSIRSEQAEYLYAIQQKPLKEVFNNIIEIYNATTARTRTKYRKLIEKLDRWIEYNETRLVENRCTLRYDNIDQIESVEVVYILPTPNPIKSDRYDHRQICFDALVEMLRRPKYAADPIAQAFADTLSTWANNPV